MSHKELSAAQAAAKAAFALGIAPTSITVELITKTPTGYQVVVSRCYESGVQIVNISQEKS